ncbi:hypothetical protein A1O1_02975 [Capronia coronata CBS 617.96]|uniref:AMP-activated protein kinase glycogen-binding domain-containing protein n=1 Tax=Capronia coronata CBS 617.96 TaxID=1182541 RepID=W9ZJA4_9EURO|nr:uncharacterized protein A1O1_02975 [Capronia coronata CBS 617.96]EXJ94579.1 hypothetical protein A1O1_02975 [Capronia coronata CBS 617.96]
MRRLPRKSLIPAHRPHPDASDVHVTGTFDDWGKTEKLNKVGDVWEKEVELPEADKKILYKFVVNDNWVIDPQAPQEDDGHGNINNVLYPDRIKPKQAMVPEAVTTSSAAPVSTTATLAGQVPLEPRKEATEVTPGTDDGYTLRRDTTKNSLPGAFPETPQHEASEPLNHAPDTSVSVDPLPATSGTGNPINLPAGEKVPPPSEVTSNTIHSSVTTSQKDYESAGGLSLPLVGGVAGLGAGIAGALGFGTSEKKENLIPESSLPMGSAAGETLDAGPTISSAGPTSTTADLAGKVPLEERKEATVIEPESGVPEVVKESIEEAHVSPEATTSAEAVQEKAEVEQELLKKVPTAEEAGEPAPTIAAATSATAPSATLAPSDESGVPEVVKESIEEAHVSPEATVSAEAVEEKAEVEQELLKKITTANEAGEPAPTIAEDPTLADEPAVRMMNQNEATTKQETIPPATETTPAAATTLPPTSAAPKVEAATPASPAPKKTAAVTPATPSSATSTPTKKSDTTPTSSPATKDKKKKNRISSLFKKIFD